MRLLSTTLRSLWSGAPAVYLAQLDTADVKTGSSSDTIAGNQFDDGSINGQNYARIGHARRAVAPAVSERELLHHVINFATGENEGTDSVVVGNGG
jgi:hypothetical protein